jgi:hypothetical protein
MLRSARRSSGLSDPVLASTSNVMSLLESSRRKGDSEHKD